jgi:hypothetical protein
MIPNIQVYNKNMLIKITIIINVPESDKDKYQVAIENIVEMVRDEFPHLEVDKMYSPVTVYIREISEPII